MARRVAEKGSRRRTPWRRAATLHTRVRQSGAGTKRARDRAPSAQRLRARRSSYREALG